MTFTYIKPEKQVICFNVSSKDELSQFLAGIYSSIARIGRGKLALIIDYADDDMLNEVISSLSKSNMPFSLRLSRNRICLHTYNLGSSIRLGYFDFNVVCQKLSELGLCIRYADAMRSRYADISDLIENYSRHKLCPFHAKINQGIVVYDFETFFIARLFDEIDTNETKALAFLFDTHTVTDFQNIFTVKVRIPELYRGITQLKKMRKSWEGFDRVRDAIESLISGRNYNLKKVSWEEIGTTIEIIRDELLLHWHRQSFLDVFLSYGFLEDRYTLSRTFESIEIISKIFKSDLSNYFRPFISRNIIRAAPVDPRFIRLLVDPINPIIIVSKALPPSYYVKDVFGRKSIVYSSQSNMRNKINFIVASDVSTKNYASSQELVLKLALYELYIRAETSIEEPVILVYPSKKLMITILEVYARQKEKYSLDFLDLVDPKYEDLLMLRTKPPERKVLIHLVYRNKLLKNIRKIFTDKPITLVFVGLPIPILSNVLKDTLRRMASLWGKSKAWEYLIFIPTIMRLINIVKDLYFNAKLTKVVILDRRALNEKVINILGVKPEKIRMK
ncbi:MAG: hypothetical protein DRJ32_00790 [Thermoprotei archaeon]|nr:MAG: hypothetical protein DRJ32_00790 [Thermoprotei archaeon]